MLDSAPLPDFEDPPVVETVLSVQFDKLSEMRAVHYGLLWDHFRERFPKSEEKPALEPAFEKFEGKGPRGVRMRFEVQEVPVLPRIWLVDKEGSEIIQVQSDRFIKNWKKASDQSAYPHYEPVIRPGFEKDFSQFKSFVAKEILGSLRINQCEVTYVNHIVSGKGWTGFDEGSSIFTFLRSQPASSKFPGAMEDCGFRARYVINDGTAQPIGRLHVDVVPGFRVLDNRPMFSMTLTARGLVGSGLEFLDLGRECIVRSFAALTTPRMHEIWRTRKRV